MTVFTRPPVDTLAIGVLAQFDRPMPNGLAYDHLLKAEPAS